MSRSAFNLKFDWLNKKWHTVIRRFVALKVTYRLVRVSSFKQKKRSTTTKSKMLQQLSSTDDTSHVLPVQARLFLIIATQRRKNVPCYDLNCGLISLKTWKINLTNYILNNLKGFWLRAKNIFIYIEILGAGRNNRINRRTLIINFSTWWKCFYRDEKLIKK